MSDGQTPSGDGLLPEAALRSRWVRAAGTLWRNAGETVVLLPAAEERPTPLVVSGSAAVIWELLAEPVTLSELAAKLAAIYEVEAQVIERDLSPVLEGLYTEAAIERSA
jgi:hypothetical protein